MNTSSWQSYSKKEFIKSRRNANVIFMMTLIQVLSILLEFPKKSKFEKWKESCSELKQTLVSLF